MSSDGEPGGQRVCIYIYIPGSSRCSLFPPLITEARMIASNSGKRLWFEKMPLPLLGLPFKSQYPQYPLRHWRQTMPCARRLHVSPIVVIDGFHLALVEFLKGHPAIAVAVHLLRRNPPEMAHLMGKRWGKYIGNSPDLLWPYWQTHHGPKSVKPRENSTFCVDMLVGFES